MSSSTIDEILVLGAELNLNQYHLVRLAAVYDSEFEWFRHGYPNSALPLATPLGIETSTVREWIRVGHALDELPRINEAFATNRLSYTKARILTRRATPDNETELLALAERRTANRLTAAIVNHLAGDETDTEREQRHHDYRSVTIRTDSEGMIVITAALPPNIGKHLAEAINTLVHQIAATPTKPPNTPDTPPPANTPDPATNPAPATNPPPATNPAASPGNQDLSPNPAAGPTMSEQLRELKQRWQPTNPDGGDSYWIPTMAQQRADAFALLFLGQNLELTTELIIHIRGDGTTFNDGTPITTNPICQQLDQTFIRLMIHDTNQRPINASKRQRHPTVRQKRVVLETHNHECVDCQTTDNLQLDHNPPYHQTHQTITTQLQPRCAPCHRARHRQTTRPHQTTEPRGG